MYTRTIREYNFIPMNNFNIITLHEITYESECGPNGYTYTVKKINPVMVNLNYVSWMQACKDRADKETDRTQICIFKSNEFIVTESIETIEQMIYGTNVDDII